MEYTFRPNARACSTRGPDVEDLLCSDNIGEGLPSPLLRCPQTPRSSSPSTNYSDRPRYGRLRSPVVEYPPSPSPTRRTVTPEQVQPDNVSGPGDYLDQLHQDIQILSSQVETLMHDSREKDAVNSRLQDQLQKKNEELDYVRSQATRTNTQIGGQVTLETLLEMEDRRTEKLVSSLTAQQKERPVIRLSDVKELTIADLSTVTSKTHLDRFFRDIEATTNSDAQRIKSAQIKMEAGIQEVMKTRVIEGVTTWLQFQDICHKIYDNKVDMITILRELNQLPYDVDEEPRLYKNRVEARLQSMPTSCETLDVRELIKKSLYKGLPKELKDQVECAVTNKGIDANDFVTMVEQLRGPHLQVVRQAKVREITNAANYQLVETAAQSPPQVVTPGKSSYEELSSSLLADLGKGQQALVRAVDALNRNVADGQRRSRKPWCGYCATNANNHWIKDCPKKPPFRSCFSCLGMGHRKGDPTCPNQQA